MALIDLVNVSKVYEHASRPALEDVNVHIDRGDFVFLVGASGAGKSTSAMVFPSCTCSV